MPRGGGYDPSITAPGVPGPEHYCTDCKHLRVQHTDSGCPWCACTTGWVAA